MALEIERKFLVDTCKLTTSGEGIQIIQAYLGINPAPTVRIRIAGNHAFLTIKGRTTTITRPEFEYEIPVNDAMEMLKMAISEPVEKIRHKIWYEGSLWEVDVFSGKNEGLVMAEIELESENQEFVKPNWLLQEVSDDARFYNSYLSLHPFKTWGAGMA